MTLTGMVKQYSAQREELDQIKSKHGIVELEEKLADLDAKIKDVARQASDEEVDAAKFGRFFVKRVKKYRKWYDLDAIRKFGKPKEVKLVEAEAMKAEVDSEKFENLVKGGFIPRELRQKAFREEEMTPSISIKEVKE